MKRLLFSLLLLFAVLSNVQSQNQNDSCYVYSQLHWAPAMFKYVAKIQDETGKFNIPENDKGEKLYFHSIMNAINYYSSQGWILVDLYYSKSDNVGSQEQYAVLKRKMSLEDAQKYITPKDM